MPDKVELEIVIGPDGKLSITTHGLKGDSCVHETKDLESAVGKLKAREKTREAFEKASSATTTVKRK